MCHAEIVCTRKLSRSLCKNNLTLEKNTPIKLSLVKSSRGLIYPINISPRGYCYTRGGHKRSGLGLPVSQEEGLSVIHAP